MNLKEILKNRQGRLLAFFDAILAIAITMLALEISIPEIGSLDAGGRYDFFVVLTCYLISFTAMGTLWYVHTMFFANHELTGNPAEIVMHLVLLFVITLFQPITRAIGEYPRDLWVRLLYIVTFLLMYGLGILIFIIIRNGEAKLATRKESMKKVYQDVREKMGGTGGEKNQLSDNINSPQQLSSQLQDYSSGHRNPEEWMRTAQELLPEEYAGMVDDLWKQRQRVFRVSVLSTMAMALAISAAVICLMFTIIGCYIALGAGICAVIAIRVIYSRDV